ncbi:1407_t:CDS:1 [Ambispora leptoticha]|uniref:1407_t:CDS:1 n=1 Tax=Ambispora leptoticha TaxID=144679 RepID=A0A9N9GA57_9GLOM|nr:1407_t:CDS:1 [Ambispora leptoticha]
MSEFHFVVNNANDTDEEVFAKYYEYPSLDDFKELSKCTPFFLFRIKVNKALQKGGRVKTAGEISRLASKLWDTMHDDEKDQYEQLSTVLSHQPDNWINISSTQYLQISTSNANSIRSELSRQIVDVSNISLMGHPIPNVNSPGFELSSQLVEVSNVSSMEHLNSNVNLPGSELFSQFVDVSTISSEEHQIPNADSPESEYFIYSKEIWTYEDSNLFVLDGEIYIML